MSRSSPPLTATYERTVDASPEAVFRAWTRPAEIVRWFGPGGFETIEAEVDLRVGGRYRLVMRAPDGALLTITGTYREVREPSRLVYTWAWAHAPGEEMDVTVELRPVDPPGSGRTRISVTHARIVDGELARYEGGWRDGLARLDALLRTSPTR